MKRLLLLLSIFTLIVFFQNCSDIGVIKFSDLSSNNSNESPSETDSGNGTGYGGKPGGIYYHYIPGYQCDGHESAFAKIDYNPDTINSTYTQSKTTQCLSIPQNVPNLNLDLGGLQNKVIGYEEKIFEATTSDPTVIPENLVEIWCVDQWSNPSIEVLSTYNIKQKQAQTEFYYPGQARRTESNPVRMISNLSVRLTSSYFNLIVNKSNLGLKAGTFEGILVVSNNNNDPQQLLQCRLGSYLDARLWPALAVNYDKYQQVEWNPGENQFYITAGYTGILPRSENRLFSYNPQTNTMLNLISSVKDSMGVESFNFTPDRSKIILTAQLFGDVATQLYSKTPNDYLPPTLLNNKLAVPQQRPSKQIIISPNSQYVYYLDGAQDISLDVETWLRMVDLSTGVIRQISHTISTGTDESINDYEVAYTLNKVVYSMGFTYSSIWVADLFGTNNRKIDLSQILGTSTNPNYGGTKFFLTTYLKDFGNWVFKNDRYLTLLATDKLLMSPSLLIVIDLSTEKVVYTKQFSSYIRIMDVQNLPVIKINSSTNGSTIDSYLNLNDFTFLTEQELINTFKISTVIQEQQAAVKMELAQAKNLCLSNNQIPINYSLIDNSTLLNINKDTSTNNYILYLYNNNLKSCTEINKMSYLPTTGTGSTHARLSPDRKNIIMAIRGKLYLVPVDNRPIIEIYSAVNNFPTYDDIGFVNNEKVFFRGKLIKDGWSQLFIWNLPNSL